MPRSVVPLSASSDSQREHTSTGEDHAGRAIILLTQSRRLTCPSDVGLSLLAEFRESLLLAIMFGSTAHLDSKHSSGTVVRKIFFLNAQGVAPGLLDVSNDDHVLEVDGQNRGGDDLTSLTWETRVSSSFIR